MTKIKICGLFRLVDADYVNRAQPDYIGLVFAPGSRRQVTVGMARELRARLDAKLVRVGVFTTNPLSEIQALLRANIIQMVQLHGPVDDPRVSALQAQGVTVIQAVTPLTIDQSTADYPLLDNRVPGSGRPLPWQQISRPQRPFFLAGGLTPQNVGAAMQLLRPDVIDVSSGVETADVKDFTKIQTMIRSVHNG